MMLASPRPNGVDGGCHCAPRGTTPARGGVRSLQVAGIARPGTVYQNPVIYRGFDPVISSPAIPPLRWRIAAGESGEGEGGMVDPGGADGETREASGDGEFHASPSDETTTRVRVKFTLMHSCEFGEKFLLVGEDAELGSWNPVDAVPLEWSEGHVWTGETALPAEKEIKFKFLLRELSGDVMWQPGSDRVLRTWDTPNTIAASYEWDVADALVISEEQTVSERDTDMEAKTMEMADLPSSAALGENRDDAVERLAENSASDSGEMQVPSRVEKESGAEEIANEVTQGGGDDATSLTCCAKQQEADSPEEQGAENPLAWAGSVMDKDIQWGRQTLDKILSRLGFYQREST